MKTPCLHTPPSPRHDHAHAYRRSGNVVIIILVAIGLFAALAYTFMRGGQQGQGNLTAHQARVAAQDLLTYVNTVEKTVNRLITRGCSENQLDFANDTWVRNNGETIYDTGHNSQAPDTGCSVFGPDAIRALTFPDYGWSAAGATNTRAGSFRVITLRIPEIGEEDQADLIITYTSNSRDLCLRFNELAGVENTDNAPPQSTFGATTTDYSGAFGASTHTVVNSGGELIGRHTFCTETGATTFRIVHVLIAR